MPILFSPNDVWQCWHQNERSVSVVPGLAFIWKKFHIDIKLHTCIKSLRRGACGSVPRWPIRAMWHIQEEGANWLAEVHELRAEQLQQSLTITVSGWGNGTAGRRRARMKLSSSWYHKIKLVMVEMTKQYAEPSKTLKTHFLKHFLWVENDKLQFK